MEAEPFKPGELVIKQGDEGDRFYLVREGQCQVIRKTRKNPEGVHLATLQAGDNFGEEALISGGKRNASVIMKSPGVMMSLKKQDFLDLMNAPLITEINYNDAKSKAQDGAIWIDVRLPQEHQERHIPGSINIPLPILRAKLDRLDNQRTYIVYCDTGRRSSTATYLLTQNGFSASILQGGLQSVAPDDLAA
jgi:rhodanese-related sulfurtransferase